MKQWKPETAARGCRRRCLSQCLSGGSLLCTGRRPGGLGAQGSLQEAGGPVVCMLQFCGRSFSPWPWWRSLGSCYTQQPPHPLLYFRKTVLEAAAARDISMCFQVKIQTFAAWPGPHACSVSTLAASGSSATGLLLQPVHPRPPFRLGPLPNARHLFPICICSQLPQPSGTENKLGIGSWGRRKQRRN